MFIQALFGMDLDDDFDLDDENLESFYNNTTILIFLRETLNFIAQSGNFFKNC